MKPTRDEALTNLEDKIYTIWYRAPKGSEAELIALRMQELLFELRDSKAWVSK